jgi:lipoyl(octanoyl) transferase
MALNVDIDLEPFARINPCGYAGLQMTDLHRLGIPIDLAQSARRLLPHFLRHLGLGDLDVVYNAAAATATPS